MIAVRQRLPSGFAVNRALAKEAGRKGGEAIKEKYGPAYFREIGRKGGQTLKIERGSEHFAKIGRIGGIARARKNRRKNDYLD